MASLVQRGAGRTHGVAWPLVPRPMGGFVVGCLPGGSPLCLGRRQCQCSRARGAMCGCVSCSERGDVDAGVVRACLVCGGGGEKDMPPNCQSLDVHVRRCHKGAQALPYWRTGLSACAAWGSHAWGLTTGSTRTWQQPGRTTTDQPAWRGRRRLLDDGGRACALQACALHRRGRACAKANWPARPAAPAGQHRCRGCGACVCVVVLIHPRLEVAARPQLSSRHFRIGPVPNSSTLGLDHFLLRVIRPGHPAFPRCTRLHTANLRRRCRRPGRPSGNALRHRPLLPALG